MICAGFFFIVVLIIALIFIIAMTFVLSCSKHPELCTGSSGTSEQKIVAELEGIKALLQELVDGWRD